MERALLVQVIPDPPAAAAHRRPPRAGRSGENAGVIDAGDGVAVAIRIESHNHPSAIEPDQGAATGVGGILRDIFAMGARPIAIMDPLFFGDPAEARQRWLIEGVVSGISGYGNSVGVPTVGGELTFDDCYRQNPLVNVLCMGVLPKERLVLGRASGAGNLAVLLGSSTGRDGIGGVSVLASAGFGGESEADADRAAQRAGGGPLRGEAADRGVPGSARRQAGGGHPGPGRGRAGVRHVRDGGPGRGGHGRRRLRRSPTRAGHGRLRGHDLREPGADAGHRGPGDLAEVEEVCRRWEVRSAVVGRVTEPPEGQFGRLRILDGFDGEVLGDVPAVALSEDAPLYHRPMAQPSDHEARAADDPGSLPPPPTAVRTCAPC